MIHGAGPHDPPNQLSRILRLNQKTAPISRGMSARGGDLTVCNGLRTKDRLGYKPRVSVPRQQPPPDTRKWAHR